MAEKNLSVNVRVNTETGQLEVLGAKLKEAGAAGGQAEQSFFGLSKGSQALLKDLGAVATVAGIISFFKEAFTQATQDEEAMRRLGFAVQAQGNSWDKAKGPIKEWSEAIQEQTRFSNTEALETLGKLSRATQSVSEAQQASQVAMGLSVQAGIPLNQATDMMQGLMQGNSRAVMSATRELGAFTGGATTAQGILDNLNAKFAQAAEKEEGAAKSQMQFKNAWDDFLKLVGTSLMPGLTMILNGLTHLISYTQNLGTITGTVVLEMLEYWKTLGRVMLDVVQGNWRDAYTHAVAGKNQMVTIWDAAKDNFKEIELQKTQIHKVELDKRVTLHAQATAKDEQKEKEQALKFEAIHVDLTKKLDALGVQTFAKKVDAVNAEVQLEEQKIKTEIDSNEKRVVLLAQLEAWKTAKVKQLAKDEADTKVAMSFHAADDAIKTLQILNSMGDKSSSAEKTRAIALMALQQAIAIGWVWVGVAKGVGEASIWSAPAAVALGAAQTAMLVAQFASQVQQLNRTSTSPSVSSVSLSSIGTPSGQNLTSVGDVGGGFSFLGGGDAAMNPDGTPQGTIIRGVASPAAAGTGQTINVNIPVINVNVAVDTLEVADRRRILQALADELRSGTVEAVRFAVTSNNLAENNSQVAV